MRPVDAAADRFFRAYYAHCTEPDEDTLFNLLEALHSFHDKFRKATDRDLFGSVNFEALKALRNLFHHESELLSRVKVVQVDDSMSLITDLAVLCLIDRHMALDAVERDLKNAKHRGSLDRDDILGAFKWYGSIANINPCVFNGAVEVFEALRQAQITPSSDAFHVFEDHYEDEEERGASHYVTGDISCLAGDANEVLRQLFGTE